MSPSVTDLEPTPVTGPSQGAPYGYCPICGAHGQTRERRPDGYDRCTCGHLYRSCEALPIPPTPDECVYFRHYGVRHPTLVRRIEALAVSVPTVVQAEDRIHRIGQTEPCTVHYLSAEGTLDEAVARSIASKTDALNIVLGGGDRLELLRLDIPAELSENVQSAPACTWTPPQDDDEPWSTSCDNLFQFFDGGPTDNSFKFCPYCGGKLVVNKVEDVADDR